MKIVEAKRSEFMDVVFSMKYRNQDIIEAKDFGCKEVPECYIKMKTEFAKYFIVYDGEKPIVTVALQRDGYIVFFIAKEVEHPIKLVRTLRKLARRVTDKCGPIITKTAVWYKEAERLNKLVGFNEWKLFDSYSLWVYPKIERTIRGG